MGNEVLDSQHKGMFELLNNLYDALQEGHSQAEIHKRIEETRRYAERHFATEEALLAKSAYSQLAEHKQEHEKYVRHVEQICRGSEKSLDDVAFELFQYLREWWLSHITQTDKGCAGFLIPEK